MDSPHNTEPLPIPGFPGYFATEDGRVLSNRRPDWRGPGLYELTTVPHRDGRYQAVRLRQGGRNTQLPVHKLVLLAFKGPAPTPRHQARHLDGNRLNNRPDNLAWGSPIENADDRRLHGTHPLGEANGYAKLTESQVLEIRSRYAEGARQVDLAAAFGVTQSHISDVVLRRVWRHI